MVLFSDKNVKKNRERERVRELQDVVAAGDAGGAVPPLCGSSPPDQ